MTWLTAKRLRLLQDIVHDRKVLYPFQMKYDQQLSMLIIKSAF